MFRVCRGAAALAASCLLLAASAGAAEPGQPSPPIDLPGLAGPVSLAKLQGKVVYVDFWASWCAPCKQSFPWLNDLQARYAAKGLQVVGVNVDARGEDARRFLAETPAKFQVGFDASGATAARFQVKGMPSSVLVGADGRVILVHAGFRAEDEAALEAAIVTALGAVK